MALDQAYIDAITEEDFTANPDVAAALLEKVTPHATKYLSEKKGLIVKEKKDYDADVETAKKTWADSDSPRYYVAMEKMLSAVGLAKPAGISVAQHVQNLADSGKMPFTAEQIATLEKNLKKDQKEGNADPAAKALLDAAKKELDDYKTAQTTKETEAQKAAVGRDVKTSLKAAEVPVDPNLKEADKKAAVKSRKETLALVFDGKYEGKLQPDGSILYYDKGKDTPYMNTDTEDGMTPLEIMQKNHADLLAPIGHQQKGGGTGGNPANPTGARTKDEIWAEAETKGLKFLSPEWHKFVNEEKAKLPK